MYNNVVGGVTDEAVRGHGVAVRRGRRARAGRRPPRLAADGARRRGHRRRHGHALHDARAQVRNIPEYVTIDLTVLQSHREKGGQTNHTISRAKNSIYCCLSPKHKYI